MNWLNQDKQQKYRNAGTETLTENFMQPCSMCFFIKNIIDMSYVWQICIKKEASWSEINIINIRVESWKSAGCGLASGV